MIKADVTLYQDSRMGQFLAALVRWKWQLAIFGIIHILIFTVLFKSGWFYGNLIQSDSGLPYFYSSAILQGHIPYLNFTVEYPPLSLIFMLLPRLFTADTAIYAQLFSVEMLIFELIGLFLVAAISERLGKSLWKTLAVYTLALLAIGPIITVRYDIIPAVVLLGALYAFMRKNYKLSWSLLAIGTFIKLFPVIVVPFLLIYHFKHRQHRQMMEGLTAFILIGFVTTIPFLILSPGGFLNSFLYQTGRGLQCETTYASFLLLAKACGLTSFTMDISSGSVNIVSPLADILAKLSLPIMFVLLLVIFWTYYRNSKREITSEQIPDTQIESLEAGQTINYWFLALLIFVITNKVLSPQYLIWFLPLIPLFSSRWGNLPWLIFVMAGLMTYFVYPKDYGGLEYGKWLAIGMLALRNVVLIGLTVLAAKSRVISLNREVDIPASEPEFTDSL